MKLSFRKFITLATLGEILGVELMTFIAYNLGWTDVVAGYGMLLLAATILYLALVALCFEQSVLSICLAIPSSIPWVSALVLQKMMGRLNEEFLHEELLLQVGSIALLFCVFGIFAFALDFDNRRAKTVVDAAM